MAIRVNGKSKSRKRKTQSQRWGFGVLIGALCIGFIIEQSAFFEPVVIEEPTRIVAEFDTVQVPVPIQHVEAGTRLRDIALEHIAFPAHQIPPGALLDLVGLEEATVLSPLPAKIPLFRENLNFSGTPGNAVIDRIPPGMRAITIRVDATTIVEGWAGSGAIVDVLLVEEDRTTVVAEQVEILSTERSVRPVSGEGAPAVPTTVTLLVSQEQALAINTALPRGRITFALRSFRDEATWHDRVYTSDRFSKGQVRNTPAVVSGYLSLDEENTFALADGKWIRTDVRPGGFLVAKKE